MMYYGAEHWYFWQGLERCVLGLYDDEIPGPDIESTFRNRCLQAFYDGYTLGLELSLEEYQEMTNGFFTN